MEALWGIAFLIVIVFSVIYFANRDKAKKSEVDREMKTEREMETAMQSHPRGVAALYDSDSPVRCPACGSTQVSSGKKGYDAGSGCCGAILVGPLGLLCGAVDANKLMVTCLKCGHTWEAGKR